MQSAYMYQTTAATILHLAVRNIFDDVVFAGIRMEERGFSCDFCREKAFDKSELNKIEKEAKRIIKANLTIARKHIEIGDVAGVFENDKYMQEATERRLSQGKEVVVAFISSVRMAVDCDVHSNTSCICLLKVLNSSAAYWNDDAKNESLQRIHAIAFESEADFDEYKRLMEEIARRDNRKIGRELELFFFDETAPGMPYWLPKGLKMYNTLIDFWRREHEARGYQEFAAPQLNNSTLWKISGHWDHYRESMFVFSDDDGNEQALKPMSCPNAIKVYQSKTRSYKDLPLRFSDIDIIHRNEKSGELSGLLRVRMFRQDDSHNFLAQEQIASEVKKILEIANHFYAVFGLSFSLSLSTRPDDFIGEISVWNKAEQALRDVLYEMYPDGYKIKDGDGAFYGPKIDIQMKDALGREWQMGTIQLDFQLPSRFGISYVDQNGEKKVPVIIHRVIYGSLERFIGIITEHFAGEFPTWFTPIQARVLPISQEDLEYARRVKEFLAKRNYRVELDEKNAKLGKKIMDAEKMKIPYMIVIGRSEVENRLITVRARKGGNLGSMSVEDFAKRLECEVSEYKLP